MKNISKREEIIERAKTVIGERNVAEIIGIAQKLLPQIEEGIDKSDTGTYKISMEDMMKKHIPQFVRECMSLESMFCVLSSVLYPHYISTDIGHDAKNFCLSLIFSKPIPREEEPSIQNCTDKWMYLYIEL